jgi:hypothetical protein
MQLTFLAQPWLSVQRAPCLQPSRTPRTAPCAASRPLTVVSFFSPSPSPTTYNMSGAGRRRSCRAAPLRTPARPSARAKARVAARGGSGHVAQHREQLARQSSRAARLASARSPPARFCCCWCEFGGKVIALSDCGRRALSSVPPSATARRRRGGGTLARRGRGTAARRRRHAGTARRGRGTGARVTSEPGTVRVAGTSYFVDAWSRNALLRWPQQCVAM